MMQLDAQFPLTPSPFPEEWEDRGQIQIGGTVWCM
jgi:hypothetical protein